MTFSNNYITNEIFKVNNEYIMFLVHFTIHWIRYDIMQQLCQQTTKLLLIVIIIITEKKKCRISFRHCTLGLKQISVLSEYLDNKLLSG